VSTAADPAASKPDTETIRQLDQVASLSWPSETINEVAGWLCRRSTGTASRRVNSAMSSTGTREDGDLDARLGELEAWYEASGGRPRFQVSPAAVPADLDEVLAARGYRAEATTLVMAAPAEVFGKTIEHDISVATTADAAWRRCFEKANPKPGEAAGRTATVDLARERGCETFFAAGRDSAGETVSIGAAIAVRFEGAVYPVIHNMNTLTGNRGKGFGSAVLHALAGSVLEIGAQAVYLLVEEDNEVAIRLYEKQGFRHLYNYHYRTLVPAPKVG